MKSHRAEFFLNAAVSKNWAKRVNNEADFRVSAMFVSDGEQQSRRFLKPNMIDSAPTAGEGCK